MKEVSVVREEAVNIFGAACGDFKFYRGIGRLFHVESNRIEGIINQSIEYVRPTIID